MTQRHTMFSGFPLCLAPMAGFSDMAFRTLCEAYGADFATTEMISAKGLYYGSDRTAAYLATGPDEKPVLVQLFGREPVIVSAMAKRIADAMGDRLLGVDLNMGCPAPKVTNNGEGSALMKEPALAGRIVEATVKAVSPLPVTVKFRKGWDGAHQNAVEFARVCEDAGAAMLTVHGRTRAEQYTGNADWACIANVKRAVHIPVIGNGDVRTGADAVRMRAETGVDGIAIGRGALGNPFVFTECRAVLSGQPYTEPTPEERRALAIRHAELAVALEGERVVIELRKHIPWYLRGTKDAARLRARANEAKTLADLREILT